MASFQSSQSRKPWPAYDSAAGIFTIAMICGL